MINNSDHAIGYYVSEVYPDTTIVSLTPSQLRMILKNATFEDSDWGTWKGRFDMLPGDRISVFVFHADTLNKYSWEEVKDKYMVLKRYDLSLDDLEQIKFKVAYPPTEAMRNVKMYPPYKE